MTRVEEMFQQAMDLDESEKRELWKLLGEDLAAAQGDSFPLHESWVAEIRERSRRIADGTDTTIPWSEVRERMFKRVRGH